MFFIKLVAYLHILFWFVSAKILITKPKSFNFLEQCIDIIQERYFKPTDFTIYVKSNKKFTDLYSSIRPMVIQNKHDEELIIFRIVKADAYLLTISPELVNSTMWFLTKTSEWNPKAKFIAILEEDPLGLFQILRRFYVFNVVALVWSSMAQIGIFTYFPYDFTLSESDRSMAVRLDTCFEGKLEGNVDLFPDKLPKKWTNTTLRLIWFEYRPYVIFEDDGEKTGIEVNVLGLVQNILGFNITHINTSYTNWGRKQPDGSYDGMYGDLKTYNADVGIGEFYNNFTEAWDLDMSFPYMEDSSRWIVPAAKRKPRWESILQIFVWPIWTLILLSFVATSFALYFLALHNGELKIYRDIYTCFFTSFQCLLGQPAHLSPKTIVMRIVFSVWMLVTCLIATAFQSQLTTVLNFDTYETQITTVEEMIETRLPFGFYKNARFLFSNLANAQESYIYENYDNCPLDSSCLDRIAFKGDFATLKTKRHMQYMISVYYMAADGRPLLYVTDTQVFRINVCLAFSKGHPIFERINKLLLDMKSSGFVDFYYREMDYYFEKTQMRAKQVKITADVLDLDELQGVFSLVLLGWFVALIVFVLELIVKQKVEMKSKVMQY